MSLVPPTEYKNARACVQSSMSSVAKTLVIDFYESILIIFVLVQTNVLKC